MSDPEDNQEIDQQTNLSKMLKGIQAPKSTHPPHDNDPKLHHSSDSEALDVVPIASILKKIASHASWVDNTACDQLGITVNEKKTFNEVANDKNAVYFSIDRVIRGQVNKTLKAKEFLPGDTQEERDEILSRVEDVLLNMKTLHCNICGLNGHE